MRCQQRKSSVCRCVWSFVDLGPWSGRPRCRTGRRPPAPSGTRGGGVGRVTSPGGGRASFAMVAVAASRAAAEIGGKIGLKKLDDGGSSDLLPEHGSSERQSGDTGDSLLRQPYVDAGSGERTGPAADLAPGCSVPGQQGRDARAECTIPAVELSLECDVPSKQGRDEWARVGKTEGKMAMAKWYKQGELAHRKALAHHL